MENWLKFCERSQYLKKSVEWFFVCINIPTSVYTEVNARYSPKIRAVSVLNLKPKYVQFNKTLNYLNIFVNFGDHWLVKSY